MIPKDLKLKYPRAAKFLEEHPEMGIDEAILILDMELKKVQGESK